MEKYKELLKELLSELTWEIRTERKLSQDVMAEMLRITTRAYGDLERGKYCFSAIALLFLFLFLLEVEEEEKEKEETKTVSESRIIRFLHLFSDKVKNLEEQEVA